MQVKFTDKAIAHLEGIVDIFLEYAGERYAEKFCRLLDEKLNKLQRFPYIGFIEPLLKDRKYQFRSTIIYQNYKLVYYVEDDTIWVSAFWDMRMNPERLKRTI